MMTGWNFAFVSDFSTITIRNSRIESNVNLETGVTASEFAVANIENTDFTSNMGVAPNVSALAFAISDSEINLDSVSLIDNTNFTVRRYTDDGNEFSPRLGTLFAVCLGIPLVTFPYRSHLLHIPCVLIRCRSDLSHTHIRTPSPSL